MMDCNDGGYPPRAFKLSILSSVECVTNYDCKWMIDFQHDCCWNLKSSFYFPAPSIELPIELLQAISQIDNYLNDYINN